MSISLNANFELLSAGLYLDARQQFNTIIEMKDFAETSIPDGFITYNKETQKHYVFNSSNTVDATLGKWREYNSGNSSSITYPTWNSNVDYKVGNVVLKDEVRYSCIADHTSTDFETDSINWVVVLEQYYHVTQEQYNKMVSDGLITDGTKDLYIIDGNNEGGNSSSVSYTSLEALGLTADATTQDVIDALSVGETALLITDAFANWSTLFNGIQYGYLKVEKTANSLCNIELQEVVEPNRRYFGTQRGGKFSVWQQIGSTTLVTNTATLKLDVTKKNNAWYGAIKLTYLYDASPAEIEISFRGATDNLRWAVINGQKYINKITYTQDSSNTAHYTIGIEFSDTTYGCYQAEVIGGFANINSLTAEAFTGDKTAVYYASWGKNNGVTLVSTPEDIGLTFPCTTVQLAQAMKDKFNKTINAGAIGVFNCNKRAKTITDSPTDHGLMHIETFGKDRMMIRCDGISYSSYTGSWIGQIKGDSGIFSDITWSRIDNDARVTTLETQLDELFQSVSSGKTLVANAITGKGVSTATDATFATMATNISKISGCKEETKSYDITSSSISPITLTFSNDVSGVKKVIPPTYSCRIVTQTSGDIFTINGKELTFYVTGVGTWEVTALI